MVGRCLRWFAVVAQRFAELISRGRGLGTSGLPQRGNGAEVAEIEEGCGGERGGTLWGRMGSGTRPD